VIPDARLQNCSAANKPVISQRVAGIPNFKFSLIGKYTEFVTAGNVVLIAGYLLVGD